MNDDIAIKVDNVSKTFRLPHEKQSSVKSALINFKKRGYEKQQALQDISFEVKKGEFFGVVGRNGSGKSTLLKIISGIYVPSNGGVQINGSLTPFIELGVGFNDDLTGRENVFLNGALLGFTRKEMSKMYKEIVEFAELERFMDQKLKNYSSGMQVRLAFSIAIRARSDILVLDEVLAVGDTAFQRKCLNFFKEIKKTDRTVILVTHNMSTIQEYCDRAIMIQDSKVILEGDPNEVAINYEVANSQVGLDAEKNKRPRQPHIKIDRVTTRSQSGPTDRFGLKDDLIVDVELTVKKKETVQLNLSLFNMENDHIAGINSTEDIKKYRPSPGRHKLSCRFKAGQLTNGLYKLNVAVYTDYDDKAAGLIDVLGTDYGGGPSPLMFTEKSDSKNGKFLADATWQET